MEKMFGRCHPPLLAGARNRGGRPPTTTPTIPKGHPRDPHYTKTDPRDGRYTTSVKITIFAQ